MLINKINAGITAVKAASQDRKLVRQVDTGVRKLRYMSSRTAGSYFQSVKDCGHYSQNPIKRLISYVKSWNSNRKMLLDKNA